MHEEGSAPAAPDPAKVEAFGARMIELFNHAGLSVLVGIGYATGLFDAMAALPASTSGRIAEAAALQERYVRDWLAAMAAGRIVDYDPAEETFRLPTEHAALPACSAGTGNLAAGPRIITALGAAEPDVIAAFQTGVAVPQAALARYERMLPTVNAVVQEAILLPAVVPLIEGLAERLRAGIEVADIGCGTGRVVTLLAEAFPDSRVTGDDISAGAVATAGAEAARLGLANARFEERDAATLDAPGRYALITAFGSIHDQGRPGLALRRIREALAPGGVFLMHEPATADSLAGNLDNPIGPLAYAVSTLSCVPTSLAQGGEGLGGMWGEHQARQLLAAAGFRDVAVKRLPDDVVNGYYIARAD